MRKIILASSSPRRQEILSQTGLEFEVVDSQYAEDLTLSPIPEELTRQLALGKAQSVARVYNDALIISADQVIALNSQIYGKPHTPEQQRKMLHALSGKTHEVITAYVILDSKSGKCICDNEKSLVRFKKLSKSDIEAYIETKEGLDRAGGYAIQGLGGNLVNSIEGDFLNIIGLPLQSVVTSLKQFDITVRHP